MENEIKEIKEKFIPLKKEKDKEKKNYFCRKPSNEFKDMKIIIIIVIIIIAIVMNNIFNNSNQNCKFEKK